MANLFVVLREATEWAEETFPESSIKSVACHLEREIGELGDSPNDPEEMADVALLLNHLLVKAENSLETLRWYAETKGVDLAVACEQKLKKNKNRRWGEPDADGVVEHIPDECPLGLD